MGLLLYKSNEMFSATELIRKSKMIFDKVVNKEIEKAIILRDGKPSFLLMDFEKYENIMAEFEELKQQLQTSKEPKKKKKKDSKVVQKSVLEDVPIVVEEKEITLEKKDTSKIKEEITPQISSQEETIKDEEPIEVLEENEPVETPIELSEEEEVNNAFLTIEGMNFNDDMKKEAQEKIRIKILQARKERAELLALQEQELQKETEEELEIKQHIEEEKLKKERELKEFWD